MSKDSWQEPVVELSNPMAAYLLWLIARDLREWSADRRCKLSREEATAMAMFLSDSLPPDARSEVEALPPPEPMLRAS